MDEIGEADCAHTQCSYFSGIMTNRDPSEAGFALSLGVPAPLTPLRFEGKGNRKAVPGSGMELRRPMKNGDSQVLRVLSSDALAED